MSNRRDPIEAWPLLGGLLLLLATLWPRGAPWSRLIGDPLGETDNHWWMFWQAARGWLGDERILVNAPDGLDLPLMDPVHLPIFLAGMALGPVLAWNLLVAFDLVLALMGGWLLGKELGERTGAWVGMAATGCAPFLAGVVDFGISESWPIGLFSLHVLALLRHARTGSGRSALAAGLSLGLIALTGWYHCLFALVIEAVLVPALWLRAPRRWGLWAQGGLGLAMVLPRFLAFRSDLGTWEHRWISPSPGPPGPREDWATLPVFGTDLLNLVLPGGGAVHPSKAVYLGLVVLLLALVGLLRAPRRAGLLLLAAAPLLVLALGYWPALAGKALGFPGPAKLLVELAPPLRGLSHWHRAVGPAVPLVAAAAAVGAAQLPRRAWLGPLLAALIALDGIALSQTAWPRTTITPELPEVFGQLEGEGGVVQLPFDNDREMFADQPARIYNRWQVVHQRSISENYEGMDSLLARSVLVAAAETDCWNKSRLPPYYAPPPEMRDLEMPEDPVVIEEERAQLRAWGYRWLVLHRERCRLPARAIQSLDRALGTGQRVGDEALYWEL